MDRSGRIRRRIAAVLLVAIAAEWMLPRDAHAYLDPGTGSYVFQIAIGAFLGGVIAVKGTWRRFVGFLKNILPGRDVDERDGH
jgi:hypothetical protein